ncbi:MAG: hypothetical protein ABSH15_07865 [Verrucomicrobiota bacterium]
MPFWLRVFVAAGGIPTDFVLVLVLVLETSLEKSNYENEDDEDDPASVFLIPFFQLLASGFGLNFGQKPLTGGFVHSESRL